MNNSFTYSIMLEQKKMLMNLHVWIDKAIQHAKTKGFDAQVFVNARLAPDQYPFVRQVQSCCDNAKFAASRLTGKEAPKHPDTEQTLDELKARIKSCVAYLDTFKPGDYEGAETRKVTLPWMEGKFIHGKDYVVEMSQPNFFFHSTTAYAILAPQRRRARQVGLPRGAPVPVALSFRAR